MRDWAGTRRGRWSASRIVAAIALHGLVLAMLTLAIDRVEMPRATDRATTLLQVVLHDAPPPPHALPLPRQAPARTPARASRAPDVAPRVRESGPQAIALPAPPQPAVAAAAPPASAPSGLTFLDDAATRQAIRGVARSQTLAAQADAVTGTRQTAGERLASNVAAAHKADCMKDMAGLGLLAAPVILAAEAMGQCAHKL